MYLQTDNAAEWFQKRQLFSAQYNSSVWKQFFSKMTFKIIICFATVGFLLANLVMQSSCQTYNFCLEKLHLNVVLLFVIHLYC